jgi:hypothetical protein
MAKNPSHVNRWSSRPDDDIDTPLLINRLRAGLMHINANEPWKSPSLYTRVRCPFRVIPKTGIEHKIRRAIRNARMRSGALIRSVSRKSDERGHQMNQTEIARQPGKRTSRE